MTFDADGRVVEGRELLREQQANYADFYVGVRVSSGLPKDRSVHHVGRERSAR